MKKVLIADDEEIIRITLMEWFSTSKYDFDFLMATNGKDAVKVLSEERVDLLITDLNMPKMDGFELLAYMNNNYPGIPIIVMSSFVTKDVKNKVAEMGAVQFLEKPFNFENLDAIDFDHITGGGSTGHVKGISLQSFLQLLNMEHKTCTLTVESAGKTGLLYMEHGELINAKTLTLEGEEAAYEIVTWQSSDLQIEIEYKCNSNDRKINFSVMHLLMESARMQDEKQKGEVSLEDEILGASAAVTAPSAQKQTQEDLRKQLDDFEPMFGIETEKPAKENPPPAEQKPVSAAPTPPVEIPPAPVEAPEPEALVDEEPVAEAPAAAKANGFTPSAVRAKLKELAEIEGFGGVALLSNSGEIIYKINGKDTEFSMDNVSILANIILLNSQKATQKMKTGETRLIHLETDDNHIFIRCLNRAKDPLKTEPGKPHIHLVLVLTNSDSLGMAKMMINTALEELVG